MPIPRDIPKHLLEGVKPAVATQYGETAKRMTLAESLASMMVEYIDGAKRMPADWKPQTKELQTLFERRLARFISADQIATIISEDASLMNGNLNTGFLAMKIAETCEGKQR